MIKKIAWETFKNTGDINTFMEFKKIEKIENQIKARYAKTRTRKNNRKSKI